MPPNPWLSDFLTESYIPPKSWSKAIIENFKTVECTKMANLVTTTPLYVGRMTDRRYYPSALLAPDSENTMPKQAVMGIKRTYYILGGYKQWNHLVVFATCTQQMILLYEIKLSPGVMYSPRPQMACPVYPSKRLTLGLTSLTNKIFGSIPVGNILHDTFFHDAYDLAMVWITCDVQELQVDMYMYITMTS